MSDYTRKGMKIIVKMDDDDWFTGLAYDLLDAIKNQIPKCDRKYNHNTKTWSIYAFPKNIAIIEPLYQQERQMKMVLEKDSFDEMNVWLEQFDKPQPEKKVVEVLL